MLTERKKIKELEDSLDESINLLYSEMTNDRKFETGFIFADVMDINKTNLDKHVDGVMSVLRNIKKIKPFKGK